MGARTIIMVVGWPATMDGEEEHRQVVIRSGRSSMETLLGLAQVRRKTFHVMVVL